MKNKLKFIINDEYWGSHFVVYFKFGRITMMINDTYTRRRDAKRAAIRAARRMNIPEFEIKYS